MDPAPGPRPATARAAEQLLGRRPPASDAMVSVALAAARLVRRLRFAPALRAFLRRHPPAAPAGAPVLVWDLGNFPAIVARNGLFATALKVRGERIHTILCDGTPVACIQRGVEKAETLPEWPRRCGG